MGDPAVEALRQRVEAESDLERHLEAVAPVQQALLLDLVPQAPQFKAHRVFLRLFGGWVEGEVGSAAGRRSVRWLGSLPDLVEGERSVDLSFLVDEQRQGLKAVGERRVQ